MMISTECKRKEYTTLIKVRYSPWHGARGIGGKNFPVRMEAHLRVFFSPLAVLGESKLSVSPDSKYEDGHSRRVNDDGLTPHGLFLQTHHREEIPFHRLYTGKVSLCRDPHPSPPPLHRGGVSSQWLQRPTCVKPQLPLPFNRVVLVQGSIGLRNHRHHRRYRRDRPSVRRPTLGLAHEKI
ncbi:unnamed protein product [Arabis nemorensis]|uniref:Uncharacterized protein n=1 Tax=Arabis nemorensis TaxID=586526 RepID=A0A565C8F1_9BRAS|nr:unnamed protein product [Arabis nemorensis]